MEFTGNDLIDLIKGKRDDLNGDLSLVKVVLFGSYAKGGRIPLTATWIGSWFTGKPDPFKLVREALSVA